MSASAQICRECRRRPARAADEFCSQVCARAWDHDHARDWAPTPAVVSAADSTRIHVNGGVMRLNLQNSA